MGPHRGHGDTVTFHSGTPFWTCRHSNSVDDLVLDSDNSGILVRWETNTVRHQVIVGHSLEVCYCRAPRGFLVQSDHPNHPTNGNGYRWDRRSVPNRHSLPGLRSIVFGRCGSSTPWLGTALPSWSRVA